MTTNNKIFGGDFNCIGNPKIDKIGGNINRGKIGFENLRNIINDFELFDVYRLFKPNDVNVTYLLLLYISLYFSLTIFDTKSFNVLFKVIPYFTAKTLSFKIELLNLQ
jgi:hypothetical protein